MPDYSIEQPYTDQGLLVAGVDEAGRGPWAGPVVAAAVILPPGIVYPEAINDSKKLTQKAREELFPWIMTHAQVGVGSATSLEIDHINILQATYLAMERAVTALPRRPYIALIDGNQVPPILSCKGKAIIKGDGLSVSIAAASIIAKVTRDRIMQQLSVEYPQYGWEKNAGYGTKKHQDSLASHGVTPHHRKSYAPVAFILQRERMADSCDL